MIVQRLSKGLRSPLPSHLKRLFCLSQPLPHRKFSGPSLVPPEQRIEAFRVMSYNILADSLVATAMYPDEYKKYLPFSVRAPKIFSEIDILKPDIIFFQEQQKGEALKLTTSMMDARMFGVNLDLTRLITNQDSECVMMDALQHTIPNVSASKKNTNSVSS